MPNNNDSSWYSTFYTWIIPLIFGQFELDFLRVSCEFLYCICIRSWYRTRGSKLIIFVTMLTLEERTFCILHAVHRVLEHTYLLHSHFWHICFKFTWCWKYALYAATSHWSFNIRHWLNENLAKGWMCWGTDSDLAIKWPRRSPEFTPCEFLWSLFKVKFTVFSLMILIS